MRNSNDIQVKEYATSLVAHDFYDNIDDAIKESIRFFTKLDTGLAEPMKCPHRIDIDTTIYKLYKPAIKNTKA